MQPISEKWEVTVGKDKFVLSVDEKNMLLKGLKMGVKVVQFKDLIINPAFIQSIHCVERKNPNQITSGLEKPFTPEQIARNKKRIAEIRGMK